MAKRFTDTNKWRKGLLRNLKPHHKLLWLYICDECDHAGIWEVEFDVASLRLGYDYDEAECLSVLGSKIVQIDGGTKWFIPSFISFQYGELNSNNRVHKSIIDILNHYELSPLQAPYKAPCNGAMDKDKDKDTDKDTDKAKDKERDRDTFPFVDEEPEDSEPEAPAKTSAPMIALYTDIYADYLQRHLHVTLDRFRSASALTAEFRRLANMGVTPERMAAACADDTKRVHEDHYRALDTPKKFVDDFLTIEQKIASNPANRLKADVERTLAEMRREA